MKKTKFAALALAAAIALPVVGPSFADDDYDNDLYEYDDDDRYELDDDDDDRYEVDDDDDDDRYEDDDDDDDDVNVRKDFKYIKKGIHKKKELKNRKVKLEKAIKDSERTVSSAQMLIDMTPKTIAKVRGKIDKLLADSQKLLKQARAALREYEEILED